MVNSINNLPNGYGVAAMIAKGMSSGYGGVSQQSAGSAEQAIKAIIQQGDYTNQKNSYLSNVAKNLSAVISGQIKPETDWQKVGVYLAQTGNPLSITLDEKGQLQVTSQASSDLAKFSDAQKNRLYDAIDSLTSLVEKQQANQKSQALVTKLQDAADTIQYIQSGGLVDASQPWQLQVKPLLKNLVPFKVSLDANGNEIINDQTKSLFLDLPADKRDAMKQVISDWSNAVATGLYTKPWMIEAKSDMDLGHSVYFELDAANNPVVKENIKDNVVPDFMKEDPFPNLTRNLQDWQKAALEFAANQKPYFLDIDPTTQKIVAKEATAQNVVQYSTVPSWQNNSNPAGALLSLFT